MPQTGKKSVQIYCPVFHEYFIQGKDYLHHHHGNGPSTSHISNAIHKQNITRISSSNTHERKGSCTSTNFIPILTICTDVGIGKGWCEQHTETCNIMNNSISIWYSCTNSTGGISSGAIHFYGICTVSLTFWVYNIPTGQMILLGVMLLQ